MQLGEDQVAVQFRSEKLSQSWCCNRIKDWKRSRYQWTAAASDEECQGASAEAVAKHKKLG